MYPLPGMPADLLAPGLFGAACWLMSALALQKGAACHSLHPASRETRGSLLPPPSPSPSFLTSWTCQTCETCELYSRRLAGNRARASEAPWGEACASDVSDLLLHPQGAPHEIRNISERKRWHGLGCSHRRTALHHGLPFLDRTHH